MELLRQRRLTHQKAADILNEFTGDSKITEDEDNQTEKKSSEASKQVESVDNVEPEVSEHEESYSPRIVW